MNQHLLNNLLLGLPTMVACLLLQALLISAAMGYYKQREHRLSGGSFWTTTGVRRVPGLDPEEHEVSTAIRPMNSTWQPRRPGARSCRKGRS